jgi:hypothetical protein
MVVKSQQPERSGRWRRAVSSYVIERPSAAPQGVVVHRERRHGGPSEDRALYTCECGYAFEALVTTSVGCPHCARTQAW